jgi:nucleotide-binding universal stress UspA family protein
MTAKEIVVGIDDSAPGRAAMQWAAAYARSKGSALRAIHVVSLPEAHDMYAYPVVADYVYPDPSQLEDRYRLPSIRVSKKCSRNLTGPCSSRRDMPGGSWSPSPRTRTCWC